MNAKRALILVLCLPQLLVAGCSTSGGLHEGSRYCFRGEYREWIAVDLEKSRNATLTRYGGDMVIESSATWNEQHNEVVLTAADGQPGILWLFDRRGEVLKVVFNPWASLPQATRWLDDGDTGVNAGRKCEVDPIRKQTPKSRATVAR